MQSSPRIVPLLWEGCAAHEAGIQRRHCWRPQRWVGRLRDATSPSDVCSRRLHCETDTVAAQERSMRRLSDEPSKRKTTRAQLATSSQQPERPVACLQRRTQTGSRQVVRLARLREAACTCREVATPCRRATRTRASRPRIASIPRMFGHSDRCPRSRGTSTAP